MYPESEFIMLSALQHYLFCPRQCALIHVEQLWAENLFTAEGRVMHERVDRGDRQSRGEIRIEYGLALRSRVLGISGRADVVEFHKSDGGWVPFPVEYKRGRPKKDDSDRVQLCAQAMCLEEMLDQPVDRGALFYGKTRRRLDVIFDDTLRGLTRETAQKIHELITAGETPQASYTKKCDACSFVGLCMPKTTGKSRTVASWLQGMIQKELE